MSDLIKQQKRQPWMQRVNEGIQEFTLFLDYLELGAERTCATVAERAALDIATVQQIMITHDWVKRAKAYHEYLFQVAQREAERVLQNDAIKWAHRRSQYREKEFTLSERLMQRATEMVEANLYQEETVEHYEDGRPKTVIKKPVKWSIRDVPIVLECVSKLQRMSMQMETQREPVESYMRDPDARLERAKQVLSLYMSQIDDYLQTYPQLTRDEVVQLLQNQVAEDWRVDAHLLTQTEVNDFIPTTMSLTASPENEDESQPN